MCGLAVVSSRSNLSAYFQASITSQANTDIPSRIATFSKNYRTGLCRYSFFQELLSPPMAGIHSNRMKQLMMRRIGVFKLSNISAH
jgi:hypothetical protein